MRPARIHQKHKNRDVSPKAVESKCRVQSMGDVSLILFFHLDAATSQSQGLVSVYRLLDVERSAPFADFGAR